jgi:hypothetical protein
MTTATSHSRLIDKIVNPSSEDKLLTFNPQDAQITSAAILQVVVAAQTGPPLAR